MARLDFPGNTGYSNKNMGYPAPDSFYDPNLMCSQKLGYPRSIPIITQLYFQ